MVGKEFVPDEMLIDVINFLEAIIDEGYLPPDYTQDDVRQLVRNMDQLYDREVSSG
jgi:hypothetical protein